MKSQSDIHLHIEELVLHGFAPGDKHGISEAVERELARLISDGAGFSIFSENTSRDRLDGGHFRMADSAKPAAIGAQIAGAVLGGIRS